MVDETGSSRLAASIENDATFAAFHSYRALYRDAVRSDSDDIMVALYEFWLARFREGYPVPRRFVTEEDEQAPAASEAISAIVGASTAVESVRWFHASSGPLERK